MKKLSLVVALVVLAFPAAAPAKRGGGEHKNSAKHCKALRAQMGADAFHTAFGGKRGKNALGRCVSAERKAKKAARKRARQSCRASGLRGRTMKRCVREQLAAEPVTKPADYQAAVEQCEAEKAEDPEGFAEEYGDGPNAFSQCVADEVSDDTDEIDEPETGDDEEGVEPGSEDPADSPDESEPDTP
jgi:hypothetical protein